MNLRIFTGLVPIEGSSSGRIRMHPYQIKCQLRVQYPLGSLITQPLNIHVLISRWLRHRALSLEGLRTGEIEEDEQNCFVSEEAISYLWHAVWLIAKFKLHFELSCYPMIIFVCCEICRKASFSGRLISNVAAKRSGPSPLSSNSASAY